MQQAPRIRVGVAGTGAMGGHHTRVASALPGCELVGIYDAAPTRAAQVAAQHDTTAFSSIEALCAAAEAVIVATPTDTHAAVATQCLQAGCHVLLEKPIAASVEEGQALVAAHAQTDRVLMIGHVERYNPAVTTLLTLLGDEQPVFACELQRMSTVPPRDQSVDIISDLMIHDLDLALAFVGAPVTAVEAHGHCVRGGLIDHVTALLQFDNGVTATLTASAVSQERVRRARLYAPQVQYTVDFASREVFILRGGQSTLGAAGGYSVLTQVEQILVPAKEPLAAEQEHFLHAIHTGSTPATSAAAGLEALRLAREIQARVTAQACAFAAP